MIIGFCEHTSKALIKIICKRFRHCVVIFNAAEIDGISIAKNSHIMIQIGIDGVRIIGLNAQSLKRLGTFGWRFVNITRDAQLRPISGRSASQGCGPSMTIANAARLSISPTMLTCVGFAKRALGIKNPFIWTPDQLYKYLIKRGKIQASIIK